MPENVMVVQIHVPRWGMALMYTIAMLNWIGIRIPAERPIRFIAKHSIKLSDGRKLP